VRVYGADSFCLVLQQKLGFALCSPADDLLLQVPPRFLQRQLAKRTLKEARSVAFPIFIKPVTPKQFRGAVYKSADELTQECRGLAPNTAVFATERVTLTAEVRSFVLDGRVLDAALSELVAAMTLPRTVVIDVGFVADRGWAVIEFNAAWGAGLNGCDREKVIAAILAASGPSVG
jgi:hypothetical protein